MKIIRVAQKVLLEFWREPQLLGMVLGLPLFFVLITAVGYGTAPRQATYRTAASIEPGMDIGSLDRIQTARYRDGSPVFVVEVLSSEDDLNEALKRQSAVIGLIVRAGQGENAEIAIRGDGTSMVFNRAGAQLERILQEGDTGGIDLVEMRLSLLSARSDFELFAPGMIVFAILLLIPQTAMLVGRENREGTLLRMRLSRLSGAEWVIGLTLSQMLIASVQVLLTIAGAAVFGFRSAGSLLLAVAIGLMLSFSAVGMGLAVGHYSRSDSDAINVGSVFTMIQVFLSGSFFAMPGPTLFKFSGVPLGYYDILPATHATLTLQQVLVGGADLAFVWPRLVIMGGLSILIFVICLLVFRR